MANLRVGVVGVGTIANQKHIPSLLKIPGVEIVALCDVIRERCEKAKADYNLFNAKIYEDYNDLCADKDIDIVHICTPNPLHCPIALAAFDGGKHVYCEKPMAVTWEECQKMMAARDKAGKRMSIGLQWRFRDGPMYIRQLAQDGYFGDIYYMKSHQLRGRRLPAYGEYTSKAGNGGGMMMDGGPHSVDLPMWIAGNFDVASVRGVITDRMKYDTAGNALGPWDPEKMDVEDSAFALVTMKNGMVLYIECAWIINMLQEAPGMSCELAGTKAGADMVGPKFNASVRLNQIVNGQQVISVPQLGMPPMMGMHDYDITHWIDAIRYDREVPVPAEEGAVSTRVIEAIYKSAETNQTIIF